jgi:hypothetical protein
MWAGTRAARFPGRLLLSALVLISFSGRAPAIFPDARTQTPRWWDVKIDLKTDGDYRLDEGGPAFAGHYSFAVCWRGWLEKDDHDYLLYRLDCRLRDWEARETTFLAESNGALTTEDFQERPAFALKYIIREGDDLRLDFIVGRMAVPQSSPEDSFALLLPSSEQNGQKESQVDYNACVIKGSNRVELPESEIYAGPVAKTFHWAWKHDQWLLHERRTVFASQSHRVEMSVSISPRLSRPKGEENHNTGH